VLRLAHEVELSRMYPGCELGAMPPFGPMYNQRVFADHSLAADEQITFNAGTHTDAIQMKWADFVNLVSRCWATSRSGRDDTCTEPAQGLEGFRPQASGLRLRASGFGLRDGHCSDAGSPPRWCLLDGGHQRRGAPARGKSMPSVLIL